MEAWRRSSWPVRIFIIGNVAFVVIVTIVVEKGFLGDGVRDGFNLFMGMN